MGKGVRELIVVYIVACLFNWYVFRDNPFYLEYSLHPYLFITIFIAMRYGTLEGALAGVIGAALMLIGYTLQEEDLLLDFIFKIDKLKLPFCLIVLGILVGESSSSRDKKLRYYQNALSREVEQHATLGRSYQALQDSLRQIERKLAGQGLGVQDFSSSMLNLFQENEEQICDHVQEIFQKYLHVEHSFLLLSKDDVYNQVPYSHDGELPSDDEIAVVLASRPYTESLYERKAVSLTNFLSDQGFQEEEQSPVYFCGPILGSNNRIVAMVIVDKIPFIHFNISNFRIFDVVLRGASLAIHTLDQRRQLSIATPFHDRWPVERQKYFIRNLQLEIEVREKLSILLLRLEFSDLVDEDQKEKFYTLISNLCVLDKLRIGWLEDIQAFACYDLTGQTEKLDASLLENRYRSYGFSEAMTKLVTTEVQIETSIARREPRFLLRLFDQNLNKASSVEEIAV